MASEPQPEPAELPEALAVPPRRARFSAIWIVPIVAALVAVGIAIDRYVSQGPVVTIMFATADGVEAGKTVVKYKDVAIGQVIGVHLTADLNVAVTARIAKSAAPLMVEDARFWVVRPRVSLSGVSGLSTLLSGNYIGFEAGSSATRAREFTGLTVPPIVTGGEPGRQFVLSAGDLGSLGVGSPVYFRRLQVGQVIAYDLAADGSAVSVRIFVRAPYDRFVTTDTRFWNASGIDISLNTSGFEVRTQSLVSLLEGGIAFETPQATTPPAPAAADATFALHADRTLAMRLPESVATRYVLHFDESIRGLSVGAAVLFYGVQVGDVTDVGLTFDPKSLDVRPRVEVRLYPARLLASLPPAEAARAQKLAQDPKTRHQFMERMVAQRGLRAQLATGSLVTGQLFVSLGYFPKTKAARIDWNAPVPELPTIPSPLPEFEAKFARIVDKLERLPLDAIGEDLRKSLAGITETLTSARGVFDNINVDVVPALKSTLTDARSALTSAEKMLASTQANITGPGAPGQVELRNALQELARAARSLRVLADYIERHPEALIRGKPAETPPK